MLMSRTIWNNKWYESVCALSMCCAAGQTGVHAADSVPPAWKQPASYIKRNPLQGRGSIKVAWVFALQLVQTEWTSHATSMWMLRNWAHKLNSLLKLTFNVFFSTADRDCVGMLMCQALAVLPPTKRQTLLWTLVWYCLTEARCGLVDLKPLPDNSLIWQKKKKKVENNFIKIYIWKKSEVTFWLNEARRAAAVASQLESKEAQLKVVFREGFFFFFYPSDLHLTIESFPS